MRPVDLSWRSDCWWLWWVVVCWLWLWLWLLLLLLLSSLVVCGNPLCRKSKSGSWGSLAFCFQRFRKRARKKIKTMTRMITVRCTLALFAMQNFVYNLKWLVLKRLWPSVCCAYCASGNVYARHVSQTTPTNFITLLPNQSRDQHKGSSLWQHRQHS